MLTKIEMSLKKQAYWLFAGKLAAFFIQFLTPVILVRLLTKSDYGLYQLSMTICFTLMPILTMGFNNSLYYFYPNAGKKLPQLLTQTLGCIFIISSLTLFFFVILYPIIRSYFSSEATQAMIPTCIIVYFLVNSNMIRHLIILEKKAILNATYLVLEQAAWTSSVVVPIIFYKSAWYGLWGLALFSLGRALFFFIYLVKNYTGLFRINDPRYIGRQIKYLSPIAVGEAIGNIGRRIDRFVVSAIVGLSGFAIYSVAAFRIPFLNMFFHSMFQVALPKLSTYYSSGDKRSAMLLWHRLIENAALVTIPSVILLQIMAEQVVIVLFYLDAVMPLRVLLITPLFQMTGYGLISRSFNKTGVYLKANLAMLSLGLILSLMLTRAYGIVGASVSAVVAFAAFSLIILYNDKKILQLSFLKLLPLKKLISFLVISLASAVPSIIFNSLFNRTSPFITVPISSFIYVLLIVTIYYTKSYISFNLTQYLPTAIRKIFTAITHCRQRRCGKL